MSHHESFAFQQLRNVINKQGIFVQQANVDVARLKLEILSLKAHVKKLEQREDEHQKLIEHLLSKDSNVNSNDATEGSDGQSSNIQFGANSSSGSSGFAGKTDNAPNNRVNIPNKSLNTDQTLEALSNLTNSMSSGGNRNGASVPM